LVPLSFVGPVANWRLIATKTGTKIKIRDRDHDRVAFNERLYMITETARPFRNRKGGTAPALFVYKRDAAVGAFVQSLVATEPETAVQWAQTIDDENVRDAQLQSIASAWLERDPQNATNWIAQSSLSDDIKARLLPQTQ
jgi:hypothetical protein